MGIEMEEKKLNNEVVAKNAITDEECIRVLEECFVRRGNGDCNKCEVYTGNGLGDCMKHIAINALDLIHRLQAENERLTEWKDKLQDTKDELEQQLIDTGFKEYCEENKRLTEENAELQKQVDELKTKIEFEKEYGDIKVAQALADFKIWKQQAVKDTAKEIYDEINSCVEQGQEYCGLDYRGLITAKTIILVWCKKNSIEVE